MRGRHRLAAMFCALLASLASMPAAGLGPVAAQVAPQGSVTVFTDGLAQPGGPISQAVVELSDELGKAGKVRLVSINGQAGPANLRDLLRFRGADFAILNSDVTAAPDTAKTYPGFADKLRYITRLRTQKLILLARRDIAGIEQLAGKTVVAFGPDGVTGYTARIVLAAYKVKAEVAARFDAAAEEALARADAVFLFDSEARQLPASIASSADMHAVPIPLGPALSKIYRAAQVQPGEPGVAAGEEPVATIQTDTILASFNWQAQQGRFADVSAFIGDFFAALPSLRSRYPASIWNDTDPRAAVPGWRQYPVAAAAAKSVPAPEPKPAAATASAAAAAPAFVSSVEDVPADDRLRLSILPQPPLTDERANGGGLLTQLVRAALERAELPQAGNVEIRWEKDQVGQAHALSAEKRAQLAFPWSGPNCDDPAQLSGGAAAMCDSGLASDPIFKALIVFFTTAESDLTRITPETLGGRTLCAPANRDFAVPSAEMGELIRDGKIKLVHPASTIDCLNLVGRGEADALVVNELEGKQAIADLGLGQAFRTVENAGFAQEARIMVARHAPDAEELLAALNRGIAKLKADPVYGEIVMKHVLPLNRSATAR